jgi:uncharacterized membrane protein (DUF106 family)
MIAGLLTALYSFYNTLFQPILALGPYAALGFFSATLAALFSGIRYMLLDHEKADKIQDKIQEKQEKMKDAREKDNPEKASKHTKEVFKHNQEFMMLNMKPMIGTMVFVALIFPWLGSVFAPTVELQETQENIFQGNFTYAGQNTQITVDNTSEQFAVSTNGQEAASGGQLKMSGFDWTVKDFRDRSPGFFSSTSGPAVGFNGHFVGLPFSLPWIGGALNWLGFYILIAMPLTFAFNKMLGIQ